MEPNENAQESIAKQTLTEARQVGMESFGLTDSQVNNSKFSPEVLVTMEALQMLNPTANTEEIFDQAIERSPVLPVNGNSIEDAESIFDELSGIMDIPLPPGVEPLQGTDIDEFMKFAMPNEVELIGKLQETVKAEESLSQAAASIPEVTSSPVKEEQKAGTPLDLSAFTKLTTPDKMNVNDDKKPKAKRKSTEQKSAKPKKGRGM
ncbi:hypothetical protein [Ascidiimonas sp. W6]|uniref:hypothetical protein n=1 Tax=Ascidiimonas meishanensis TaxID=3128903 RepID=UPI0030EDD237